MGLRPSKDIPAFKKEFIRSNSIKRAALAAGYSQNTANMGLHSLPKALAKFVETRKKKLDKLAVLARSITPQNQEELLRGAIFDNIASGKDKACNSIRLGMQDKRVSMLTADIQVGVQVNVAALSALESDPDVVRTPVITRVDGQLDGNTP